MTEQSQLSESGESIPRVVSRLGGFATLKPEELAFLRKMAAPPQNFARGEAIRREGHGSTPLYLLLRGWAASSLTLPNGSRQLNSVSLPGDMLGLPSLAVRTSLDELVALSPVTVCKIAAESIGQMFAERPRLAALLFLVSQEERVFAMERLALVGRAPARARLAALFVRLYERIALFEDNAKTRFFMPLTQREMGDLIGVSAVHVNSLIREFKTTGVAMVQARELSIPDLVTLRAIAGVPVWQRSEPNWLPTA